VRILVAGTSNILFDIISAALAKAPDMEVAGVADSDDLISEISQMKANALITQNSKPGDGSNFIELMHSFPGLKVVAIANDGSYGFVHELHVQSKRLGELSADALQAALWVGLKRGVH
jgi:hypothetical protein